MPSRILPSLHFAAVSCLYRCKTPHACRHDRARHASLLSNTLLIPLYSELGLFCSVGIEVAGYAIDESKMNRMSQTPWKSDSETKKSNLCDPSVKDEFGGPRRP
jgi:hypothetical protein